MPRFFPLPPAPPSLSPNCVSLGRTERRTKGLRKDYRIGVWGKGKGKLFGETGRETGETLSSHLADLPSTPGGICFLCTTIAHVARAGIAIAVFLGILPARTR